MAASSYSASAPATIMLFGEHAVLHHKLALVAAVDQRLTVTLAPREDREVHLISALGEYHTTLDHLNISAPFHFVLTCIDYFLPSLITGMNLTITSSFSSTVGLGSSAAVVAATTHCLMQWLEHQGDLFTIAQQIVQRVQGCGSGADVAASIYGGVIAYRIEPLCIEPLNVHPQITLIYAGYKTPTPEVIRLVQERNSTEKLTHLYEQIDMCVQQAKQALRDKDLDTLTSLMAEHHAYQQALGVSDAILDLIVQEHAAQGAKISGSGLGDCVLVLGHITQSKHGTVIPIQISPKGIN